MLMRLQNEISLSLHQEMQGKIYEVMAEGPSKNDASIWSGRTRSNHLVLFTHEDEKEGDFISVKVTQPQTWLLKGNRVS